MLAEEMTTKSTERAYERSAWLVEGPKTDHSLCVLLDREHYRDDVQALPIFSTLMQRGTVPPMTLVCVWHGEAAARHTDYVCDPQFGRCREHSPSSCA